MQPDVLSSNFGLLNIGSSTSRSSRTRNQQQHPAAPQVEIISGSKIKKSGDADLTPAAAAVAARLATRRPLVHRNDPAHTTHHSNSSKQKGTMTAAVNGHRRSGSLRNNNFSKPVSAIADYNEDDDLDVENQRRPSHTRTTSASSAAGIKRKRQTPNAAQAVRTRSGGSGTYSADVEPARSKTLPRNRSGSTNFDGAVTQRRPSSSRSSLSLRQGLDKLALSERQSSEEQSSPSGKNSNSGRTIGISRRRSSSQARLSPESPVQVRTRSSSRTHKIASDDEDVNEELEDDFESSDDDDDEDDDDLSGSSEDDSTEEDQDGRLLTSAPAWQLERIKKDRLARLAQQAQLNTDGLTKTAIIELIVDHRPDGSDSKATGPPSSNTRSRGSVGGHNGRASSMRLSQPPSDHSADYTDVEGGDNDERVDEEVSTPRKPLRKNINANNKLHRQRRVEKISPHKPSPVKRVYPRRLRGLRRAVDADAGEQGLHRDLTDDADAYSAGATMSPMVNRLRKQKSLLFAASSPVRARAKGHIPHQPAHRAHKSAPTALSPIKLRLRPRQQNKDTATGTAKSLDDRMEEDWIDSVSLSEHSSNRREQSAGKKAKGRTQAPPLDVNDIEMRDDESSPSEEEDDADEGSDDEPLSEEEADGQNGPAEDGEVDYDSDSSVDSDRTDGPGRNGHRAASPSSPAKMRRLRNGKLRIVPVPDIQVEDTDGEVDAQLPAEAPETPRPNRRKSSPTANGPKTMKAATKPKTPPLSSNAKDAQTAEAEVLEELNGLDLESLNLTDKEIPPRQLDKTSRIGSGGFKDVYVGVWKVGKRRNKVAIADIREKLTEMDIKELGLLRDLKHENIVRFIGVSIPEDTARTGIPCMIVSELCSNGDLWDYIRGTKPPTDLQIFRMLLETARGLEYLHMHSIVHRDVKSSNVLVTRNRSCKINDFGLARVKRSQRSKMKSVVGTVNWQAVELWCKAPQYTEKVDVWSAAMTFWEALQWHEEYKSYPFESMNEFEIYEDVGKNGHRPPTNRIEELFGVEIVKLLNRMWDSDPRKRPTMDMVCADLERLIQLKTLELEQ
ncbi:unnamed protein product [Sympodiomycopsis kandeliae]